jgi:hypothetical protein
MKYKFKSALAAVAPARVSVYGTGSRQRIMPLNEKTVFQVMAVKILLC